MIDSAGLQRDHLEHKVHSDVIEERLNVKTGHLTLRTATTKTTTGFVAHRLITCLTKEWIQRREK